MLSTLFQRLAHRANYYLGRTPYRLTPSEARAAWVADLTSGRFEQAQNRLVRIDPDTGKTSYCCLGVACETMRRCEGEAALAKWVEDHAVRYGDERQVCVLPEVAIHWLGVADNNPDVPGEHNSLAKLNDQGRSFAQIAAIIASEPEMMLA